jgi:hypothetical protein
MAERVEILVKAKNEASATLGQVKSDLKGLDSAAQMVSGGLAGFAAGAGIGAAVGLVQQLGSAVVDLARQSANVQVLRSSFDGLAAAAGQSSAQMLEAMRTASQGMVADQELVLSANRAMMLGVADNANEMAQLLEVATVRGRAMGLSTADAFSDLVTGIGRMSPLILDNLGIVTGGEAVFDSYAESLGRTAASLSDAERKQALLNKVISETDLSGAQAANQFERMDAALQNAKMALGELFSPAITAMAQDLADAVTEATDAMTTDAIEKAQTRIWNYGNSVLETAQKLQDLQALSQVAQLGGDTAQTAAIATDIANTTTALDNYVKKYNEAASITGAPLIDVEALRNGEIAYIDAAEAAARLAAQNGATAQTAEQLAASMTLAGYASVSMASGLSNVQAQAGATMGIIYNLTSAVNQLNAATGVMSANSDILGGLTPQLDSITSGLMNNLGVDAALAKGQELKVQYREQVESLREQGYTSSQIELILRSQVEQTQQWASGLDRVATATGGVSAATSTVNQEYSNLLNTVQGLISGALDTGVGVKAEDLLPREDDINENARRLADIAVNGFTGQSWLEEFKNEVPEIFKQVESSADPKGTAARMLREFELGLRPELLDKGAIKERVKQMLLGDANAAALAQEIAEELAAEMGIPLQQALAAAGASLGVPASAAEGEGGAAAGVDMTSAGAGAGASFTAGFQSSADGAIVVASIVTKMEASYTHFVTTGSKAGTQWGAGFMSVVESGVSQPLIQLLAVLVTPAVLASIQAGASQTAPPP